MTDLLAAWRTEPIVLSSPMPIEVSRRWLFSEPVNRNGDLIWRRAAKLNTRSPWRPVLRGKVLGTDSGSMFVGVLGWDPVLKVFTCCWLGVVTAVASTSTAIVSYSAVHGDWRAVLPALGVAAGALIGVFIGLLAVLLGYREAYAQTEYLRSWIIGSMNAPWYRNRQIGDK